MIFRLLTILFMAASLPAATHYVATTGSDTAGDGTIDNPWRTILHGMKEMAGGDTLYLRGGLYLEHHIADASNKPPFLVIKDGLGPSQLTTIASYPGERAIFRPTPTGEVDELGFPTDNQNAFYTDRYRRGPNYMKFDGFTIDMASKTLLFNARAAVRFFTATHLTFTNMHFLNNTNGQMIQMYAQPGAAGGDGAGPLGYGGNHHLVGNIFSNSYVREVLAPDGEGGTKLYLPSDVHPLYWYYQPDTIIEHNQVFDVHSTGLQSSASSTNITLRHNVITRARHPVHWRGSGSKIYNNIVINPTPDPLFGDKATGFRIRGANNFIANNTLYSTLTSNVDYGLEDYETGRSNVWVNNIAIGHFTYWAAGARGLASDTKPTFWTNNIAINLRTSADSAQFKLIAGTVQFGMLLGDFYNPGFVNVNELPNGLMHAANGPAQHSGRDLSSIFNTSFNGVARPQGPAFDLGAFEIGSAVAFPAVTLSVPSAESIADELTGASAFITVTRTGSAAAPLTVSYQLHAATTAVADVHYAALTSPIVIPAGQSSAKIEIEPLPVGNYYPSKTVAIQLVPTDPATYTATIYVTPPFVTVKSASNPPGILRSQREPGQGIIRRTGP